MEVERGGKRYKRRHLLPSFRSLSLTRASLAEVEQHKGISQPRFQDLSQGDGSTHIGALPAGRGLARIGCHSRLLPTSVRIT
ncbi:hypothetical protein VTN96DRAFT_5052 [Rasamsonia emersonii]